MPQLPSVTPPRRIVAFGGGGFSRWGPYSRPDNYVLGLPQKDHPRVLYLGTAGGDADPHIVLFYAAFSGRSRPSHLKLFGTPARSDWRPRIRDQDVIYVGGGSTATTASTATPSTTSAAMTAISAIGRDADEDTGLP